MSSGLPVASIAAKPAAGLASHPWLRLGRVSNLPTVWSDALAGACLAGADLGDARTVVSLVIAVLALSASYEGGMVLNDAFDRAIDARERPGRPIPAGQVGARAAFTAGFALVALGLGLLASRGVAAGGVGLALALAVIAYDRWHKGVRHAPWLMGACRACVYLAAAAATTGADALARAPVLVGAGVLWAHIVGLSHAARHESRNGIDGLAPLTLLALAPVAGLAWLADGRAPADGALWPVALIGLLCLADASAVRRLRHRLRPDDVPRSVAQLIAAVSLLDASAIALAGGGAGAVLAAVAAYVLTRLLQRHIPGT